MRWLAVVVILACSAAVAQADARKLAIVVGDNRGDTAHPPLHYAEADAAKVARVLVALGGVAPDDLVLLQGKGVAAVTEAVGEVRRRIAGGHATLVFYFAGRADGDALELAGERLPIGELRRALAGTGAEVRVAIIDTCRPRAAGVAPGAALGPAFDVKIAEDGGDVVVTSTAADELALEVPELGGSLFTHHLVSALRGAGDANGDGVVTLAEAYHHAYERTVEAHDGGRIAANVALTELGKPVASIELPRGFDRALVYAHARGQVVAELDAEAASVVGVEPGRYAIRAWRAGQVLGGRVRVAAGERRIVRWDELSAHDPAAQRTTGVAEAAPAGNVAHAHMLVAGGASAGVAGGVGAMPAMRAEVALPGGLAVAVIASSKHDDAGFRETSTAALVGYRLGLARGGWAAWGGAEAGGGLVMQTPVAGPVAYAGAALAGPCAGLGRRITNDVSLAIEAALPVALMRSDGVVRAIALPAAWLGARFEL